MKLDLVECKDADDISKVGQESWWSSLRLGRKAGGARFTMKRGNLFVAQYFFSLCCIS